jgi:hypothetical protein
LDRVDKIGNSAAPGRPSPKSMLSWLACEAITADGCGVVVGELTASTEPQRQDDLWLSADTTPAR